jgi:hypothetical protein
MEDATKYDLHLLRTNGYAGCIIQNLSYTSMHTFYLKIFSHGFRWAIQSCQDKQFNMKTFQKFSTKAYGETENLYLPPITLVALFILVDLKKMYIISWLAI